MFTFAVLRVTNLCMCGSRVRGWYGGWSRADLALKMVFVYLSEFVRCVLLYFCTCCLLMPF